MKKILVLLSLLIIALFVVSCTPKEGAEEGALAGQAVGAKCIDSDGGLKYEIKGYASGKFYDVSTKKYITGDHYDYCTDKIGGTTQLPSGSYLAERRCFSPTIVTNQFQNCLDLKPKGTKTCINGACVGAGVCGNKVLEGVEVCDDGNQAAGDGCSKDCKSVEAGWKCVNNVCYNIPEICANGLDDDADGKIDCLDSDCFKNNTCESYCDGCDAQCDKINNFWTCVDCTEDSYCQQEAVGGPDYKCLDYKCVKTCTPGPTGKNKCLIEGNGMFYAKEYQNITCTTYLSKDWKDKIGCGYDWSSSAATKLAELCKDDVGCCKVEWISSYCDGNVVVNTTKNTCTGEIKEFKDDCSLMNGSYNKKPKVCGIKTGFWGGLGCYDSCLVGEEIVKCYESVSNKDYYKYFCNNDGLDYKWNVTLSSCPTGTTCQNKDQWGAGVCK